jgi:hypothetical protein
MPLYYFDIYEDGEIFADAAGVELATDRAAEREAASIAAELARDHLGEDPESANVEVRARDPAGRSVCVKSVHMQVDGAEVFSGPSRPHL